MASVALTDVEAARDRIMDGAVVRETPIEHSRSLSGMVDADVWLKMEHLQRTGSFKTRGAYNKLRSIAGAADIDRVVAASAGNHAQGVALAAAETGVPSTIVMPRTAAQAKVDATRGYGGDVILHGRDFGEAMTRAKELATEPGVELIHAFDDPVIVAGQGTIGVEIYEQLPAVDTVVVPVGGGGLIGGIATAFAELDPGVRVVGVQTEKTATVPRSLEAGAPVSIDPPPGIADGIATGGLSDLTFGLIRDHVDDVVIVSDDDIAAASLVVYERAKQIIEGAGAAPIAAILGGEVDVAGRTVVPVLSGGNIDMAMLQTVLTYALADRDQLLHLRVRISDTPGKMTEISGVIAEHGGNIRTVRHDRAVGDLQVGDASLVFEVVTGGAGHAAAVIEAIEDAGYPVTRVN